MMTADFSKDGKFFAQLSVDGKLKIWNTATSKFEQEFTPDFHLTSPCTCLQFVQPVTQTKPGDSPKKKIKRRNSFSDVESNYIILGTTSGVLLVYSVNKAELETSIDSATSQSITCLSWQQGYTVYSAADQNILCWDIHAKRIKNKWKGGNENISAILKIPNNNLLLTGSKNIKLWDLSNQEVLRTFTGHKSNVTILEHVNPGNNDSYFLSGSKGDRVLSCWNLKDETKNAVANFIMEDVAVNISMTVDDEGTTNIAAVTRNGTCHIFQQILNGKSSKPLKPKSTIRVVSDSTKEVLPIPIVSAVLTNEGSVLLAHGIAIKLVFESVVLNFFEKVQCLIRKNPSAIVLTKDEKVSNIKTPVANNVQYLTPYTTNVVPKRKNDGSREVPMEQRLENLTLNKLDSTSKVPKVNNVAHLLLQGIHGKDKIILRNVLNNRDPIIMLNTVKRLPIDAIIPLVKELTVFMQGKTLMCQSAALWLKAILQVHAGLLISNPEMSDILAPILGLIKSRLTLRSQECKLSGRLDLLLSQVTANSLNEDDDKEALLVYNDKALSDSDMDIMEVVNHSESENDWAEDTDDDDNEIKEPEENGDSDEEMST